MGKLIRFRRKGKAKDAAERPLFPPFAGPSTDARPAAYPSDASVDALRPGQTPDPVSERKNTLKRRWARVALALVFAAGWAATLFGDRGYLDVQRQRARLEALRVSNVAAQERVDALKRQVDRLRTDPSAVERIAREDLGYVAPGEITLLLPGDDPADAHALDAKNVSAIVPAARRTP